MSSRTYQPSSTARFKNFGQVPGRRVSRGACFHQPYLGTREFSADFGEPDNSPRWAYSEDLGVMLHTIHNGPPIRMEWFTARLDSGVLHVPAHGIEVPATEPGEA
jgi:CRISPR-associated protein Cas5d